MVEGFLRSDNRPEWMILQSIPVIPPELRPMVQLDGGRFATTDLNDLYRRVINRNNRLKRLLDLGAPEIIVNNEKRMLQEAVDALFDNGRRGRAVTGPGNRPLKSLSDMLKGKQGRFRQNLLGKRVDYSGRSVIVAGPELKLHQCGIPKTMALELFKPFVMSRLVERKQVQNIKAAKKLVESEFPEVWDILEEVISEHPVMLNRAPTLHRLGIQAFEPVLIEGKAIQLHPLVCTAFNADFDGDQMAVHLPLSVEAQAEARILMLSSNNILSPAHGRPIAVPTQDMILGCYYLTYFEGPDLSKIDPFDTKALESSGRRPRPFGNVAELEHAYAEKLHRHPGSHPLPLGRRTPAHHRGPGLLQLGRGRVARRSTSARTGRRQGRKAPSAGTTTSSRTRSSPRTRCRPSSVDLVEYYGAIAVAHLLDVLKDMGFQYASVAGVTISKNDIVVPPDKEEILQGYEAKVRHIQDEYLRGNLTDSERRERVTDLWTAATEEVADAMEKNFRRLNPVYMMANSGARGSFKQIRQLAGMRGLMASPKGEIIERPIKANFMEGLGVLEYFISTHGARKGLADTALRTADSGYLTRRLVDVAQEVVIREHDCGTTNYIEMALRKNDRLNELLLGRVLAVDVADPETGEIALRAQRAAQQAHPAEAAFALSGGHHADLKLKVRSVLGCQSEIGVCQLCYGRSLAANDLVAIGEAVGHIAAQSIGEPGTQLTMRTFHTGGVAGADITHGLPRVVELFEARKPKGQAKITQFAGTVQIEESDKAKKVNILDDTGEELHSYAIYPPGRPHGGGRPAGGGGRPALQGLAQPARAAQVPGSSGDRPLHRGRGAGGLPQAGRADRRQARGAHRPADDQEGPRGDSGRHQLPARAHGRPAHLRPGERAGGGRRAASRPPARRSSSASPRPRWPRRASCRRLPSRRPPRCSPTPPSRARSTELRGLKENVIIGKLIPAATGLRAYRNIELVTAGIPAEMDVFGDGMGARLDAGIALTPEQQWAQLTGSASDAEAYNMLVDDLDLPTYVHSVLSRAGIERVSDLLAHTTKELLAVPGLGQKSLEEVRTRLAERGWALSGDERATPRKTDDGAARRWRRRRRRAGDGSSGHRLPGGR